jgi:hypothetical protein
VPILQWRCAHGEAPALTLACAPCLAIAPLDDSVDTNAVRILGEGIIESFGEGPPIVKRVMFAAGVTLKHNPPRLELLTGRNRVITVPAVGLYACAGGDAWYEIQFSMTGAGELSRRLDEIERRLMAIEAR